MENPFDPLAITAEEGSEFYRVLGRALWAIGAFENDLVYYIVVVLKSSLDTVELAELELERSFGLTLGNLIREFRKHRELASDLDQRLDTFKSERDWLCHRIFRQNQSDLLNRYRFEALLHRLHHFKSEATALSDILHHGFDEWCIANGITQEELSEAISETLQKWKGS